MKGNFQIIILIVFVALAIFGVLVFSGAIPIGKSDTPGAAGTVVLWGTEDSRVMSPLIEDFNNNNQTVVVKYVEKSDSTFDQDLLEALADGAGPDMVLLPDDLAFHYANKIATIPYTSYPLASFQSNFASASEVFLNSNGVMAFPLSIDPLVMYYNRSILDAAGVVYPPTTWDGLSALIPTLTQKDDSNKILKSAVALGQFSNVTNAKDILVAMFMQAGNKIVTQQSGTYTSTLNAISTSNRPLAPILKFYTDFADPNNPTYSWNKSFPNSDDAFSSENVALYFGYASELPTLVNKNPNQNFSVSTFPQIKDSSFKATSARVLGLSVLSSSKNFSSALSTAGAMATTDFALKFANALGVAPARRDLLASAPSGSYAPTFYSSALYARSWLDPSATDTNNIFRTMVNGVLSNSTNIDSAISDADSKLELLLSK